MEDKLVFEVEWRDPRYDLVRQYKLILFPATGEVEMVIERLHSLGACILANTTTHTPA